MLSSLGDEQADYLIVGAYALAAHGLPRATGDIDSLIRPSRENAERVLRALRRFGAPAGGLTAEEFTAPDHALQIGVEPCRIDILSGIDGVTFEAAWAGRVTARVGGLELPVLSKADLLRSKLAVGRDKDLGDIAWLQKHQDR